MFVEFRVQGKPPKKDSGTSMWRRSAESIINLRKAAFRAREEHGIRPFGGKVFIDLTIYGGEYELKAMGDLDNLVGGICDGLQQATAKELHPDIRLEGRPFEDTLLYNDAVVYEIRARKMVSEGEGYYDLKLGELQSLPHHE